MILIAGKGPLTVTGAQAAKSGACKGRNSKVAPHEAPFTNGAVKRVYLGILLDQRNSCRLYSDGNFRSGHLHVLRTAAQPVGPASVRGAGFLTVPFPAEGASSLMLFMGVGKIKFAEVSLQYEVVTGREGGDDSYEARKYHVLAHYALGRVYLLAK